MTVGLLRRKRVLITGAGPNIGRALAVEMGEAGADVRFTDIDERQLGLLESDLERRGVRARGFRSDITREEDIEELVGTLRQDSVRIDTLVNNVAVERPDDILDGFTPERWEQSYLTNVVGPLRLTREIARSMIDAGETRGSILFITSIHQWTPRGRPAYSASKAALGMVIKELALELAPHGIRVNGIAPGYVRSDGEGNPVRHRRTPLYSTSVPPRYIGRAAVYLASEHFSRHTTGTVLKVDAGLSLYNHIVARRVGVAEEDDS